MKVGFFFPGYGSQFVGMGKEFYDISRPMQEYFDQVQSCLDKNFIKLCFASSEKVLAEFENSYISLYLLGISLAALLQEEGVKPSVVAGYDIGEYTALSVAGSLSLPDAVYLLRKYAAAYTEFLEGKEMEAVRIKGLEQEELEGLCAGYANGVHQAHITIIESDTQFVVVGTKKVLSLIKKELKTNNLVEVSEAHVGGGLHTSFVDEVLKKLKIYLEKVDFKDAKVPFVAGVTGQAIKQADSVRAALMQQIHAPLNLKKTLGAYAFCDVVIILGPGQKFQNLLKKVYPNKHILNVVTPQDMHDTLTALGKLDEQTGDPIDDTKTKQSDDSIKKSE